MHSRIVADESASKDCAINRPQDPVHEVKEPRVRTRGNIFQLKWLATACLIAILETVTIFLHAFNPPTNSFGKIYEYSNAIAVRKRNINIYQRRYRNV